MGKLTRVGSIRDFGGAAGRALTPVGRALTPVGRAVGDTLRPVGQALQPVRQQAISKGQKAAQDQINEWLPEPGSLRDDLSDDEQAALDEHLEGILAVVGDLGSSGSAAVTRMVGAIFDAAHGGTGAVGGLTAGASGSPVDVIGLEPHSGALGGGYAADEWK